MGIALGFEAGNIVQNQIETEGVGDGLWFCGKLGEKLEYGF